MKMKLNKTAVIVIASAGGAIALGTTAICLWNSRRARITRGVKQAKRMMYRVGSALCKATEIADEMDL